MIIYGFQGGGGQNPHGSASVHLVRDADDDLPVPCNIICNDNILASFCRKNAIPHATLDQRLSDIFRHVPC